RIGGNPTHRMKSNRQGTEWAHLTRARKNQRAFLAAFAVAGTVRGAAAVAHVHRRTHYKWIETDPDYAATFEEARETFRDVIRDEVHRRGIEGWREPVFYKGQIVRDKKGQPVTIRKFSDRMLELLAKATCPEYREKYEVTGVGGGPVTFTVITGVPQPESGDT